MEVVQASGRAAGLVVEIPEEVPRVGHALDGDVVRPVPRLPERLLVVEVVGNERLQAVDPWQLFLDLGVVVATLGLLEAVDGEVDEEAVLQLREERGLEPLVVAHDAVWDAPEREETDRVAVPAEKLVESRTG